MIDRFVWLREHGRSRDEALEVLRAEGASPMQCLAANHEVEGVALVDAKKSLNRT